MRFIIFRNFNKLVLSWFCKNCDFWINCFKLIVRTEHRLVSRGKVKKICWYQNWEHSMHWNYGCGTLTESLGNSRLKEIRVKSAFSKRFYRFHFLNVLGTKWIWHRLSWYISKYLISIEHFPPTKCSEGASYRV